MEAAEAAKRSVNIHIQYIYIGEDDAGRRTLRALVLVQRGVYVAYWRVAWQRDPNKPA